MHDPASTQSSPRSFSEDFPFPHYAPQNPHNHHALTYPLPAYHRPQHKSTLPPLPIALSVSTSTAASDHDPNESTARPSNAHKHAQFLAGALTSDHSEAPSLLFTGDPLSSDDPGATPVVTHPPSSSVATTGLPTPLPPADPSAEAAPDSDQDYTLEPGIARALSRPLTPAEQEKLAHLDRLKFFLATAPSQWDNARSSQSFAPTTGSNAYPSASIGVPSTVGSSTGWGMGLPPGNAADGYTQGIHPSLNRFMLPSQEFVTCVLWNGLYHITGTDIVRALVFRFEAFGRPVRNMKKFEEGVFSDLRNLKPGVDACLEEPKSPFLDLLFKYQCIRTQKKQKVFYWFSVPHDRLFLDALERDLKREKMGFEPTTHVVGEPALSFTYDPKRSLYEQFAKSQGLKDGEGDFDQRSDIDGDAESDAELVDGATNLHIDTEDSEMSDVGDDGLTEEEREHKRKQRQEQRRKRHLSKINGNASSATFFSNLFGLFEGSPTYKQRRKKNPASGAAGSSILSRSVSSSSSAASFRRGSEDFDDRGRPRSMGSYGSGLAERHHHHSTSVSRERSYPYPHPYTHVHRQSSSSSLGGGSHPFQYSSMEEEFGPGSMDARERAELDAATLFHRQARGELIPADGVIRKPKVPHVLPEVGVMISEGFTAHPVQGAGTSQSGPSAYHHDSQIEGYPPPPNGFDPNALLSDGHGIPSTSAPASAAASPSPYEAVLDGNGVGVGGEGGKVRAFMCPLYSCGRLFKRMEHLKRHVRTHTMERPYSCPICQRKFSRSDNLNQHLKTHDRPGSGGVIGGSASASYGGGGGGANVAPQLDGMGVGGMGGMGPGFDNMGGMGMWRDSGNGEDSDLSGAEEGFDDEFGYHHHHQQQQQPQHHAAQSHSMMFGMPSSSSGGGFGLGMGGGSAGAPTAGGGRRGSGFDMQMCEIEVQASEVSEMGGGEEEGLVFRNHHQQHQHQHHLLQQQQQFAGMHHPAASSSGGAASSSGVPGGAGASGSEYVGSAEANWQQAQAQQQQQQQQLSSLGAAGGMMDMNSMGGMTTLEGMNTIDAMTSMGAMNTLNNMNTMNSMSAMNTMNTMNAFNPMSSMNTMNTMGSMGSMNTINAMVPQNEFVSSMSAPSHKRSFDHVALYHTTANILESTSNSGNPNSQPPSSGSNSPPSGSNMSVAVASSSSAAGVLQQQQQQQQGMAGPMRRHRSMTPSLIGRVTPGGESIRRPMSTVSNASSSGGVEGGGPGSGRGSGSASPVPTAGMGGAGRVYHHPYAGSSSNAAAARSSGSAHSSPAVYNTPLGPADASVVGPQGGLRRSESRTSFMHHHHHSQMEPSASYAGMEMSMQQQQQQYGGYDPQQQQQQQQRQDGEYYSRAM